MNSITAGFAFCGSFCTFERAFEQMTLLVDKGIDVVPIMSFNARNIGTRFGSAEEHAQRAEEICGKKVIATLEEAEPIGPQKLLDILIVEPCTGNTLGKLANGITDTPVTLACKAHLRNERPLLIAVSTNDALGAAAKNIGHLMNCKNIYFVPMKQDDCVAKPNSMVACYDQTYSAVLAALAHRQAQPVFC